MDRMDAAAIRLDKALRRLEGSLDSLMERAGDPGALQRERLALLQDRDRLAEQLDASIAREAALQGLADEASEALGSAIQEVRAALSKEE
ncbi:MAG: DUF4164 family protein [Pseudomonadota bacterium]